MQADLKQYGFIGIVFMIVLLFFYLILGLPGLMAISAIVVFFILPIYLILNNLVLDRDEKLVFSFFIGVGVMPSLAYWTGFIVSFKIAVLISFFILILTGILFSNLKRKH